MQSVDSPTISKGKKPGTPSVNGKQTATDSQVIDAAISMLGNIVEIACEQENGLDLMRLVNFMDLYKIYLQCASDPKSDLQDHLQQISAPSDAVLTQKLGETEFVSFERFVRDSRLLAVAARVASREEGETIKPPTPLMVSANS